MGKKLRSLVFLLGFKEFGDCNTDRNILKGREGCRGCFFSNLFIEGVIYPPLPTLFPLLVSHTFMIKENNLNSNNNLLQFYVLGEGDIKLKHGTKTKQQIFHVIKNYIIITAPPLPTTTPHTKIVQGVVLLALFIPWSLKYLLLFVILLVVLNRNLRRIYIE